MCACAANHLEPTHNTPSPTHAGVHPAKANQVCFQLCCGADRVRTVYESVPLHNNREEVTMADVDLGKDMRVTVWVFKVLVCLGFHPIQ